MDSESWKKYHSVKNNTISYDSYIDTKELEDRIEILNRELTSKRKQNLRNIIISAQKRSLDCAQFNVPKIEANIFLELRNELKEKYGLRFYCIDNTSRWRGKLLYDYDYNQWVVQKPKTVEELAEENSSRYEYGDLD